MGDGGKRGKGGWEREKGRMRYTSLYVHHVQMNQVEKSNDLRERTTE